MRDSVAFGLYEHKTASLFATQSSRSVRQTPCKCFLTSCVGEAVVNVSVSIFLQHTLENTWQQTDIQRMHYLSTSSVWQEQKACWFLDFEMPFSSPRLHWLGELHFFLRCHWTLCKEKLTLSPLCLAEGLSLSVQVQIAVLLFLL